MEELLRKLNSRNQSVRDRALAEARALTPEELMTLMELEGERFKRRKTRVFRVLTFLILAFVGGTVIASLWAVEFLVLLSMVYYFLPFYLLGILPSRARRSLLKIIETTDDPRFVVPALRFLAEHRQKADVRASVVQSLKRLLPRFRADQAVMLTPAQHKELLVPLTEPYKNPDLSICLLKALEQIGNESALPVVSKIAGNREKNKYPDVVQAAQECLEFLQIRVTQQKQAQTLLRPSSASEAVSPATLLRPAIPVADNAPEELLRVAVQPEERSMENRPGDGR